MSLAHSPACTSRFSVCLIFSFVMGDHEGRPYPMAIIMHIDFNSYFASVEQQANPFLRGKAIAVGGKGRGPAGTVRSVVTTASREAKSRGVKTGMATWEARKLCPELIVVPGDPQKYGDITNRLLTVCKKYADNIEQFSTDEVFLDVTVGAQDYFGATLLAQTIRAELKAACGSVCTASIGIAPNLLVAKLASESVKPNGLTTVLPDDVENFVRTRPLKDFCGIGRRTEKKLEAMGVTSVDTLRTIPRDRLIDLFKSQGEWLANAAVGIGNDQLAVEQDAKSVGHSYTFPTDLLTRMEVWKNLLALSDRVASRLRHQGASGYRVSGYVRYGDFESVGGDRLLKEPLADGLEIATNAWRIIEPKLDLVRGVRLVGVTVSELRRGAMPVQIFAKPQKMHAVLGALDKVQSQFGHDAWQRATTVGTLFRERTSGWHYDHELMAT